MASDGCAALGAGRRRGRTPDDLAALGEAGLRAHLEDRALRAHAKYPDLGFEQLPAFLEDPECLRHPTRLVFDLGDMAPHQFAQPEPASRRAGTEGVALFVHPGLLRRPEMVPAAVAYAVPQINYGDIVTGEHCLLYGATLLGMLAGEYYDALCALADAVGARPLYCGR